MKKNNQIKKAIACVLVFLFTFQQSCLLQVLAEPSMITGITPVGGANGEFNIAPNLAKGEYGFRHYENFKLSEGDIANLIFQFNGRDVEKFVNLVDSQIVINGLVNTMRNGNFYNGNAVFVSPNGMMVGASGVLNVGSLSAMTPGVKDYLSYTAGYYGTAEIAKFAASLGINIADLNLPQKDDDVTYKLLQESDMGSSITIKGKVFARDSVELISKNINIGNTSDSRAGIFAGLPTQYDEKMTTIAQADALFNHLVTNNIQHGSGFDRDALGNVVIKAQSFKTQTIAVPDTLVVKGVKMGIAELFMIAGDQIVIKSDLPEGVTATDVLVAYKQALNQVAPASASDPNSLNTTNAATVNVSNSVIAGKNVDINAVSKTTYVAQKGSTLFERALNTALIGDDTGKTAESIINSIAGGSATFDDFEGARAKASVVIDDNSLLFAKKDVDVKSLALADLAVKIYSIKQPMLDATSELFYYLGTQTDSSVTIKEGAILDAGEDINLLAASKNNVFVKIKNPTSGVDTAAQTVINAPSMQLSFMQTVSKADTKVDVQKGVELRAGQDVNAIATNVTSDQTVLKSVASIQPPTQTVTNTGIAVAANLKETELNTSAIIDGIINAGRDVNVYAQNMHASDTQAIASVEKLSGMVMAGKLAGGVSKKVTGLLRDKLQGIDKAIDTICAVDSLLPTLSIAFVNNDSSINTLAKVGKNADITAGNDVNVVANTMDLATNYSSSNVEIPDSAVENTEFTYRPSPGISFILNNQNNNTLAIIENGDNASGAKIDAVNDINVVATTEQPMNDSVFSIALNLVEIGADFSNLDQMGAPLTALFDFDGENWDPRVLLPGVMAPKDELIADIKNLAWGLKNSGITSNLGLQGFFNNWSQALSQTQQGTGISASIVVSEVVNNTQARIGNYANLNSKNLDVNAANKITQFNASGDVGKIWKITEGASGGAGIGGSILVELLDNNALAEIGDNAEITVIEDIDVLSANDQDLLTVSVVGSHAESTSTGLAVSGSVVVQDLGGKTKSSVGASKIDAKTLNVNAGQANISLIPSSLDALYDNPFEKYDSEVFETQLEPDLASAELKRFIDSDVSLGIDGELGYDDSYVSDISVIKGSGLTTLNPAKQIKDGISNLIITGALAKQDIDGTSSGGAGATASSGIAAGASVNTTMITRSVDSLISDGATITLGKDLNVVANSRTETLDLALAGAFAGGVDMHEVVEFVDHTTENIKGNVKYWAKTHIPVYQKVFQKKNSILNLIKYEPRFAGKFDENKNPILDYKGVEYKSDFNGQYYDPKTGTVLKDSAGQPITTQSMGLNNNTGATIPTINEQTISTQNMSSALAGTATAIITETDVNAYVGKANITVGKDANVSATHTGSNINIGAGIANAATVGAGAAVNVTQNENNISAIVDGATINFVNSQNNLNINAKEENIGVQVAIGVGSTKANQFNPTSSAAIAGSFNAETMSNSVVAQLKDSKVSNIDGNSSVNVNVTADNYNESYKAAGGLSVTIAPASTSSIGAGLAGNINAYEKTTSATVDNSNLQSLSSLSVVANTNTSKDTEKIVDVGVGGLVITGGLNTFTMFGATSVNVFNNSVVSQIINKSVIDAIASDINVLAYNGLSNWNTAGALGFSLAQAGLGFGAGAIFNVADNSVISQIANSDINNSNNVKVYAINNEDYNAIALNFGYSSAVTLNPNGVINVLQSSLISQILDSNISANNLAVNTLGDISIFGITGVLHGSNGEGGTTFDANVISNNIIGNNYAIINGSNITTGVDVSVEAISKEKVELIPIGASAATSLSVAANVSSNVITNDIKAYINDSILSANNINVSAIDEVHSRTRGGTVAGSGKVALSGAIISDVIVNDIEAYILASKVETFNDININANAKNIFGYEDSGPVTISSLITDIENGDYDPSKDLRFDKWDMVYDISGSGTAAVAGSLNSKAVANSVNAYIGNDTEISKANDITITATNKTSSAAITGAVGGSGTAAVGSTLYMNVAASDVNAYIADNVTIGSIANVGNITINADSIQQYNIINLVAGGSGTAAVNGSLISNILVNETNAYIAKNSIIKSNAGLDLSSDETVDIEALQIAANGSGTVAVEAIANVNVINNKVSAIVGKNNDSVIDKKGSLEFVNPVNVDSSSQVDYQSNVLSAGGAGTVGVAAVAISNTMASDVTSGIEETSVTSKNGSINVASKSDYNKNYKYKTNAIRDFLNDLSAQSNTNGTNITPNDFFKDPDSAPLVMVFGISGAGVVAISGSVVNNNVITEVNSYVKNATINSEYALQLISDSSMTTYDLTTGVAGAANVGGAGSGVVNVYAGNTKSIVSDTVLDGSLYLDSNGYNNLNTITFMIAGSGEGATLVPVINVNTVVGDVISKVIDTTITNAKTVKLYAKNSMFVTNSTISGSGVGIGADINLVPLTNVFVGSTVAGMENTSVSGQSVVSEIEAEDVMDIQTFVVGLAFSGVGANISGYALTNVFDNDLKAYITGSAINDLSSLIVNADSSFNLNNVIAGGGLNLVGASTLINTITNVIDNSVESYIKDSTIFGGSIATSAVQKTTITNGTFDIGGNVIGATPIASSQVNVFLNDLTSYIENTGITDAFSISVSTDSDAIVKNMNMGVALSGTAAAAANATVNVIENTSHSYIDAKDKTVSSAGTVSVNSSDYVDLVNEMGMVSGAVFGAGGANVNVNVINNTVKSEILSSSNGQINAKNVVVDADFDTYLDEILVTPAAGLLLGVAGNVVVNTIGSKVDLNNSDLSKVGLDTIVEQANLGYNNNVSNITYQKEGVNKSLSNRYSLTGTSNKEGTISNVSANIIASTSSDTDGVSVTSKSVVRGAGDDGAVEITNGTGSAGSIAATASVVVHEVKYNTSSMVSGGEVVAKNGKVSVTSNTENKVDIQAVEATLTLVGVAGNVGYVKNNAITEAIISSSTVDAKSLYLNSSAKDKIVTDIRGYAIEGVGVNVNVAVAKTNNQVNSKITGSNVNITAKDIDILASNSSELSSELRSRIVGAVEIDVLSNEAKSSSITNALIDASGVINASSMDIIASSDGVSAKTVAHLGSASVVSGDGITQGAYVDSSYSAGINNNSLTVNNAGTTNIKSGVKTSNTDDIALMKAEIDAKNGNISIVGVTVTDVIAEVGANTSVKLNAKNHNANEVNILSSLSRTTSVGSSSNDLGIVEVDALYMVAQTNGTNIIDIGGTHTVADTINISLADTATADATMLNGELSFVGIGLDNAADANIDTDTTINLNGNLNAREISLNQSVLRYATNNAETEAVGLVECENYSLDSVAEGDSIINIGAKMTDSDYSNKLTVTSKAANYVKTTYGENYVALAAIANDNSSENKLNATNNINLTNANIISDDKVEFNLTSENRTLMQRTSGGVGAIIISGGEMKNDITANANIKASNSSIDAKNVTINATSILGNIDNKETTYVIDYGDIGIHKDYATITNNVNQSGKVELINSNITAKDIMDVNVKTDSTFMQSITGDGSGFVAKISGTSNLTVANTNEIAIDDKSKLLAGSLNINMDSDNILKSHVDIDSSHFGGRDPIGRSYLTLTINNKVNNLGSIQGVDDININFMRNSSSNLSQDSNVIIEAAIATGGAYGQLNYNVNNNIAVAKGADITAGKTVLVNYTSGINTLHAKNYCDKISRILLGIPIHDRSESSNIEQKVTNSLALNGEIVAGDSARKHMVIDRDGNVVVDELKGFTSSDYKIVNAGVTSGVNRTNNLIAELDKEIAEINKTIEELSLEQEKYENEIAKYEAQLLELQRLYDLAEAKGCVVKSDVMATMKGNISSDVVDATDANKISQNTFDKLMTDYESYVTNIYNTDSEMGIKSFADFIVQDFYVVDEIKDNNGNVTQVGVKLTDAQVNTLLSAIDLEKQKIDEIDGTKYYTYDDKIVVESVDSFNSSKSQLANSISSLTTQKDNLTELADSYTKQLDECILYKNTYNDLITHLKENPLGDVEVGKSAIDFSNLKYTPGKIELKGIANTSITGNGDFKTYSPNVVIDNYSNRDLIFGFVNLDSTDGAGLYINGANYNHYANTLKPVNIDATKYAKFEDIPDSSIGTNVHYIVDDGIADGDVKKFVVNNYFDHSNPTLVKEDAVASNLIFNGYIIAQNGVELFNDSGNIYFNNYISSNSKDIVATQGDVIYKATNSTLDLASGDRIIAGKNVSIKAQAFNNAGNVSAGYANRNLTITDAMLSDLIIDPTTGEKNMINLGGSEQSAYLNSTNNIKALYKDGKILLFNTKQEGGNVEIVTNTYADNNGTITYTNGFADVSITNQTNKELVVNGLENNRMNGVAFGTSDVNAKSFANTKITSAGKVSVIGYVINGKNMLDTDSLGMLEISSQNGVDVVENILGAVVPTIDVLGNVNIINSQNAININSLVQVKDGKVSIANSGTDTIINAIVQNNGNGISIDNSKGKVEITDKGSLISTSGNILLDNKGENTSINGKIQNDAGSVTISNSNGKLFINDVVSVNVGDVSLSNSGIDGVELTSNAKISAKGTSSKLIVTNTQGGVTVADGAELLNNSTTKEDNLTISNSGNGKVSILGKLTNKKGNISINNDGAESGVEVGTTGTLTTEDGNTTIANLGKSGIDIEGKILTQQGNIEIFNKNSNIEIGEYNSSNDSYIEANNVMISQNDGSIINGVNDEGNVGNNQNHDLGNKDKAYKTLIKANNLVMVVQNGDIGSDTHALSDKESGFGVDASTRDYTESINVEVSDTISAIANNDNNALINIRAKNSNLNIDNIVSDGNVMLTVADWKQPDQNPTPSNEEYYHGYSINNASKDGITLNVVGRNISIISSDNIGSESNKLTYEQLENGSVSILAENDIYVSDKSANSNINALITKRGTLDIELDGDAVINEITSGKKLKITSLAKNLTIYSLGKISPKDGVESDILFPHDGISGSSGLGVVPEQIEIKVLDVNQDNSNDADSTLNIYSAYLKGADNGSPDVLLRADNIIAHAYQAPSSKVITKANPSGFDAQTGRTYINNQGEVIEAAGFNTVGEGKSLTFDIQGVSKDDVIAVNKDVLSRKYNTQQSIKTTPDFENKNAVLGTLYMVDDLSLSLNSSSDSSDENRGMQINKLYVNNAYVDTKDLTLSMDDGFVNNYAEFVNGNRGGTSGAHSISDSYRWKTVVDNDYYRNVAQQFDTPVTTQLYTALTGSFNLSMGDSIKQASKAPAVVYDVYEVFNRPYSENSFYRHTYKENKIQLQSVNALFDRRDNYSHMPNKREFIRFGANLSNDTIVDVAYKTTSGKNRILAIHDISKGGLLVTHDGSLKLKEQFNINLVHNDVDVNVDVKVVRIEGNKAGLQFVNLDQAKANKILYLNLSVDVSNEVIIKESKR